MKNKGVIFFSGLILILTVLLAIPTYRYTKKSSEQMARRYNSQLSPVIMIPGSSATENRFDGMVAQLNSDQPKKHGLLKIKVMTNGRIKFKGKISARDTEPIIVVGFENNRDGYSNIKKHAMSTTTANVSDIQTAGWSGPVFSKIIQKITTSALKN